jgi:predicted phosphodiesterase
MRVAALYDVHGNLPALGAVLADPRCAAADVIVSGGDLVAGPFPAQCLDRLEALGDRVRFLMGNGDREVVSPTDEQWSRDVGAWVTERLALGMAERVRSWPATVELEIAGLGAVLFCHATPASDLPILTRQTPEGDVERELGDVAADAIVCGHTHVQYDRRLGAVRLVNAGSVGMPYEGSPDARWALLGPDGVGLVSTPDDAAAAFEDLAASGFPLFEQWLAPPLRGEVTAEEATAEFERRRRGA